jgi:hypothetical protein
MYEVVHDQVMDSLKISSEVLDINLELLEENNRLQVILRNITHQLEEIASKGKS